MFNVDDEKRPVPRASLLDIAAGSPRVSARAQKPDAKDRGSAGSSLLDRFVEAEQMAAQPGNAAPRHAARPASQPKIPSVPSGAATRPPPKRGLGGADGKIARWLAGRDADDTSGGSGGDAPPPSGDRPLVDIKAVLRSVWQVRFVIAATTILGAAAGVAIALSTPSIYLSESRLYIDPREVRLTDSDLSKQSLATEAILALVDSQLEVLRSRTVMEKVARDLDLQNDAEFSGTGAAEGEVSPRTLQKLSDAIRVWRDPKTFIVIVEAQSRSPQRSALIVNRLVETFLGEETAAQSGFFQKTTAALDQRIFELKAELDTAEKAIEEYKARNDIVGAGGELIADKQLLSLSDQVAAARNRIADAKAKADVSGKVRLDDVLTGAFPEEVGSMALAELRKQYAATRAQLSSLDASLGPRHPQRIAAVQSLESSRAEIAHELRRIAATAQTELDRAERAEQDLVRQFAAQKARQINSSGEMVELRELQRNAAATREIYESFLKRASETREEEKLTAKNIRVVSRAEPALQPKGPSRKIIVIGATMAGFFAGFGLGILLGIYRSLNGLFVGPRGAPPETVDPDPPEPGTDPDPMPSTRNEQEQRGREADLPPPFSPAAHHAQSLTAAYLASRELARQASSTRLSPLAIEPEDDLGIAKVQDDLRALRSRVESYSRQKVARR
ncbi:GumC family protein [Ensifer sp. 4252]|uniref:GumC family protein n=1 Tax=Ensifer sp. 4252 TaxID=3373915 RepID=UPI003D24167E